MCEAGFLHLRLGEPQHAFERFSDALAFNPHCSKALLGVGFVTQVGNKSFETHKKIEISITIIVHQGNSSLLLKFPHNSF